MNDGTYFLILLLITAVLVPVGIWTRKKQRYFSEKLLPLLNKNEYKFSYTKSYDVRTSLSEYRKLPLVKYSLGTHFIINGFLDGENFSYFQIFNGRPYSILVVTAEKYEPKFASIEITPETVVKLGSDYHLEWGEFNRKFINKFDDPRKALEVVTPTFMETLVNLQMKYRYIQMRYVTNDDYQTESVVIIKRGTTLPLYSLKKTDMEICFGNLVEFIKDGIELKKSI